MFVNEAVHLSQEVLVVLDGKELGSGDSTKARNALPIMRVERPQPVSTIRIGRLTWIRCVRWNARSSPIAAVAPQGSAADG